MRLLIVGLVFGSTPFCAALEKDTGIIILPAGVVNVSSPFEIAATAHDLDIRGAPSGTTLRAAADFQGAAIFVAHSGQNLKFTGFTIDGNRDAIARAASLPPSDVTFARFTRNNGLLMENVTGLTVARVQFKNVAGFPILVSRSRRVRIEEVAIQDSGSQNARKRNNATGGILLEEGSTFFEVLHCDLKNIRGNGIWTHSLYSSPRNAKGTIKLNRFATIGRDAIQVGHATAVRVEQNDGVRIGYPADEVAIEDRAIPAAIDTAGNVDQCAYVNNHFEEINGKCMDLDGFHDGEIRDNRCVNSQTPDQYRFGNYGIVMNNSNPDMQSRNIQITGNTIDGALFGGIFVIGTGHRVSNNHLLRLNLAHCNEAAAVFGCYYAKDEPDMLRSGIYLGRGAERPDIAHDNVIENNEISGYKMSARCIAAAPGVSLAKNRVAKNECTDEGVLNARAGIRAR